MEKKYNIEQLIEDTLNSTDGAAKATAQPFLLTRINARLGKKYQGTWDRISACISKPVIAIPVLTIVLALNAAAIFFTGVDKRSASTEQLQNDTADELPYGSGSFYDIVNTSPQ